MMTENRKILRIGLIVAFIVAAITNLTAVALGCRTMANMSKPLLMPLLCLVGLQFITPGKFRTLYIAALSFHTLGDVLLIFHGTHFFLAGIGAFLLGHIMYFIILMDEVHYVNRWVAALLPGVVSFVVLVMVLSVPGLHGFMSFAVTVYAYILLTLLSISTALLITRPLLHRWLWTAGFLLFIISDSLIGIHVFLNIDFAFRGFAIMSTYILAQTLITSGFSTNK